LKIGALLPQGVQVESGLEAGDRLIVRGQREIADGEKVNVVKNIQASVFDLPQQVLEQLSTQDIEAYIDKMLMTDEPTVDSLGNGEEK
jgi:hypothetical protein